jgi:hypothetical protein
MRKFRRQSHIDHFLHQEVEGKRARKNGRFAQMKNLDVLTSSHLNEFTTILVADFIAPPVVMVTDGRNGRSCPTFGTPTFGPNSDIPVLVLIRDTHFWSELRTLRSDLDI